MSASWPSVLLHEICNPKQWPTIGQECFVEHGFPVYGANGKIGFYTEFNHAKPTILITCRGATCGTINVCEPMSYVTGNSMALDDLDERRVHQDFLVHALRGCGFSKAITGTAQPQITRQSLTAITIPLPPLPEQRRIADILDRADALRSKRRAALAMLDTLVQAVFIEMFGDQNNIAGRWPGVRLGDVLDFLTSGSRGWASYYADAGDLFIRIQNVRYDELRLDDIAYVKPPNNAEAQRTRVQVGDVLLSITADLGRTAVVPDGIGNAFISQHLSILRTKAFLPRFLSAYLTSPAGQQQVASRNRQGVKAGLNFDDIRSFVIPSPPHPLQHRFIERVAAIEQLKSSYRSSLNEFDALFASLQHRAFRGEL